MNVIDGVLIALLVFFGLLSLVRGAVFEIVSVLKWVLSWVSARLLYAPVSDFLLGSSIESPWVRHGVAFGAFFIFFYFLTHFLGKNLTKILVFFGLGGLNRLLGIPFGVAKALFIIMGVVFLLSHTPATQTKVWQESVLLPYVNNLLIRVLPRLKQRTELISHWEQF
ncbi:MAG: CvpA family protein [Neisseriaceae bacterium]